MSSSGASASSLVIPSVFTPNVGQFDAAVRFSARGAHHAVFATDRGVTLAVASQTRGLALRLTFVGALPTVHAEPAHPEQTRINYFSGRDPAAWRSNLPTFGEVRYRDVWPGVDAAVAVQPDGLKYEFHVSPGSSPSSIRLRYDGATRLSLAKDGDLRIESDDATLTDAAPRTFQLRAGHVEPVPSSFVLFGDGEYGIVVGAYDRTQPLIIDPTIVYASYLGSSGADEGRAVAVDAGGQAYVTGWTQWIDFPVTPGAFQTTAGGDGNRATKDAFVAKINPTGSALVYATYLGGTEDDQGNAIAVDSDGNAYVTGSTRSADFPTTAGSLQPTPPGGGTFVTKLNASGSGLVYSTYYGGAGLTDAYGIAVDGGGRAYVVGRSYAPNLPGMATGFQPTLAPGWRYTTWDGFLVRLSADGAAVEYGTYLGGMENDAAYAVSVNGSDAFVAGDTFSGDFPTTPGAFDPTGLSFVLKSANGGTDWASTQPLRGKSILALVTDPTSSSVVYAGTGGQGVYKSTTSGDTFVPSSGIPAGVTVYGIAVDPTASQIVYAGTSGGVYKSVDGGAQWTFTGLTGPNGDVSVDAHNGSVFALAPDGVWRSVNGGASWTLVLPDTLRTGFNTVAAHPSTSGIVFASQWTSSGTGLYRSTDGGASWISAGAGVSRVNRLRIDPSGGTMYAAADTGLFKSSDGGTSFASLPRFGNDAIGDVTLDPWASTPATIYTIPKFRDRPFTIQNIFKSPDGGATVYRVVMPYYVLPTPRTIAVAGRATVLLGFIRSTDGFVTRVNTATTGAASLVYSTYLSGSLNDSARSIAVDASGRAYVAVSTSSPDFPTTIGGSATGDRVVKINETGSGLFYSTRVGDADLVGFANGVAVDALGSAYISGGIYDDFNRILVAKYSATGNPSVLFRFGGAAWADIYHTNGPTADANAIAVSPEGTAIVTGIARTTSFPTTPGSFQQEFGSGSSDAFVVKIAFDGSNTPPAISSIANSTTAKNTPITITFTVSDAESGASGVTVSGASSNTAVVPNANMSFAGSGAARTLTITPAANQVGSTTITVTASDGSLTSARSFSLSVEADVPVPADYDGDGQADPAIYRPSTGQWEIMRSSTGYASNGTTVEYTPVRGIPVPGDYDGDGRADVAVYQPSIGGWWIRTSRAPTTVSSVSWGLTTDVPVPGDYDGDGKTDPAVFRPSTGGWYVLKSSTGYTSSLAFSWGLSTDIPVPGDYDGDGKTDPAVFRRSTGGWYVLQSSTGYTTSSGTSWGLSTDTPMPRDYDGDGRIDPAIYRPSNGLWAILKSTTNYTTSTVVSWGLSTDDPAPSDYDADRKSDPAIYRSSTRSWYILSSKTGYTTSFGVSMPAL